MHRFTNIIVVCDQESAYEAAFARATWLGKANGARITLVDVIEAAPGELARLFSALPGIGGAEVEQRVIDARKDWLQERAETLRAEGLDVTTEVRVGTAFIEITRKVMEEGHDLVIKGAQRSPDGPFFRGPDMHLMRKCPCPVWILNSSSEPKSQRILAAVNPTEEDGSEKLNELIRDLSSSLARQDTSRLDVLTVWSLPEEQTLRTTLVNIPERDIAALLERERSKSRAGLDALVATIDLEPDNLRVLHVKGVAADVIPEYAAAENIDTIVMGTVARTGVAGLLIGNTAETILNRVKCSILTVKPDGFVSPVKAKGAQ